MASEAVIPNEERILSAWVFTVGVIRARMVVVFSMNKMWHICSYKQAVVLPYIYFACLWTLGCWGNGAWKMILMAGGRGQVEGGGKVKDPGLTALFPP